MFHERFRDVPEKGQLASVVPAGTRLHKPVTRIEAAIRGILEWPPVPLTCGDG